MSAAVEIFRHVVLFRWRPESTRAQIDSLERALSALPGQVPQIRAYRYGSDAGLVSGNFDFAIVADFDDAAAFRAYVDHPAHQKLVALHVRPLTAERAAVQYRTAKP